MQQLTYTAPGASSGARCPSRALDSDAAALVRPLAVATCDLDALIVDRQLAVPAAVRDRPRVRRRGGRARRRGRRASSPASS